jgi:hypothetical protein
MTAIPLFTKYIVLVARPEDEPPDPQPPEGETPPEWGGE